jgi:hypothetical protein
MRDKFIMDPRIQPAFYESLVIFFGNKNQKTRFFLLKVSVQELQSLKMEPYSHDPKDTRNNREGSNWSTG